MLMKMLTKMLMKLLTKMLTKMLMKMLMKLRNSSLVSAPLTSFQTPPTRLSSSVAPSSGFQTEKNCGGGGVAGGGRRHGNSRQRPLKSARSHSAVCHLRLYSKRGVQKSTRP